MKYSDNFERDYNWYLKYRDVFTFLGNDNYKDKVVHCENGKDAKFCFYKFDSEDKIIMTSEPQLLTALFRCKVGINWQIKEWALGRADCTTNFFEFIDEIAPSFELLPWMIEAVENQKFKYYK